MELKRCDKCGTDIGVDETIKIEYTYFHYCNKCLLEIKRTILDTRAEAIKIVATELAR